ncbi:solute carrier family 2, facilitated glucose transporter member 8-like isoform X2 [Ambystoma mexicanum]
MAVWLVNTIGRKMSLVLSSLPFLFGFTVIIGSPSVWVLCIGRLIAGVGVGMASLLVPIYVAEIAHRKNKRVLISCIPLMVVVGILGVYVAGLMFPWRWLVLACCVPPFMMLLAMIMMPETPRFLLKQKRRAEALNALAFLRGPDVDHEWEANQIEESIGFWENTSYLTDLKDPTIYKPLILGSSLRIFQQLTGICAVIFYSEIIFADSNFEDSSLAALIVAGILLLFAVVSLFVVEKTGRRVLLIISAVIMMVSTALLAVFLKLSPSKEEEQEKKPSSFSKTNSDLDWMAICSVGTFVAGFGLGWGPVPVLVISEMFPLRVRVGATGFCLLICWAFAFLVTMSFIDIMTGLSAFGAFLFFSIFCVLNIIFVVTLLPETKGKTLEEMAAYFRKKSRKK